MKLFPEHLQSLEIRSNPPRLRGMSYICSRCGELLYHIGAREAISTGTALPLQPFQVAARVKQCPKCGHKLQSEPTVGSIKITAAKSKSLSEALNDVLDYVNEELDRL